MQQGCPVLCPLLPVVAASCQPNKREPLSMALHSASSQLEGSLQPTVLEGIWFETLHGDHCSVTAAGKGPGPTHQPL